METGAGFAADGAGAAPAPSTSPLVTRPSRPLPWTEAVSMPFSAAILAADGEAAFAGWAPAGLRPATD